MPRGFCPKGGKHNWTDGPRFTDSNGRVHQVVICTKCGFRHDKVVRR